MAKKIIDLKNLLVNLFVIIDDFVKMLQKKIKWKNKWWRKPSLCRSEVITLKLFWIFSWFKTNMDLYKHISNYHIKDFPNLPSYKSFNQLINTYSYDALVILNIIMNMNLQIANNTNKLKVIDSTKIQVCTNKRIFNHKVCKWLAERWKSSTWWFYWFKLHMVTDDDWRLLSFKITPWNIDDRNPVKSLFKNIKWTAVWDTWYLSKQLKQELKEEYWIDFITWTKKTMKNLMTKIQHNLLKARQIIETAFWALKQWRDLVSSYARSITWHFARIIYSLLSYCFNFGLKDAEYLIS